MQLCRHRFEAASVTDTTFADKSTLFFVIILPPIVVFSYVTENATSVNLIYWFFYKSLL